MALEAGCDVDMEGSSYLADAVERGDLDVALVDDAVRRVLRLKFALGVMDAPYRYCDPKREAERTGTRATLAAARRTAAEATVLLRNDGDLLPLDPDGRLQIALIGALANDDDGPLGSWRVAAEAGSAVRRCYARTPRSCSPTGCTPTTTTAPAWTRPPPPPPRPTSSSSPSASTAS